MQGHLLYDAYYKAKLHLVKVYAVTPNAFHIMIVNAFMKKRGKGRYCCIYREAKRAYCPVSHVKRYYRLNESLIRMRRIEKRCHGKYTPNYYLLQEKRVMDIRNVLHDRLMNRQVNGNSNCRNNKPATDKQELMLNSEAYDSIYKITDGENNSVLHTLFNQDSDKEKGRDRDDSESQKGKELAGLIQLISLCERNTSVFAFRNNSQKHCITHISNTIHSTEGCSRTYLMTQSSTSNTILCNTKHSFFKAQIANYNNKAMQSPRNNSSSIKWNNTKLSEQLHLNIKPSSIKLFPSHKQGSIALKQTPQVIPYKTTPVTLSSASSSCQIKNAHFRPKIIATPSFPLSPYKYPQRNPRIQRKAKSKGKLPILDQCNIEPMPNLPSSRTEAN